MPDIGTEFRCPSCFIYLTACDSRQQHYLHILFVFISILGNQLDQVIIRGNLLPFHHYHYFANIEKIAGLVQVADIFVGKPIIEDS